LAKPLTLRHMGNESLFLAVEMSLISTLAGIPLHIHAEGLRGTGMTTVMRWVRHSVPKIRRILGCPYHCLPESPHCPVHRDAGPIPGDMVEEVPMPFVEIGHGAKLGTVLGSIDLERLTDPGRPQASLMPGAIPMANRGIIFIDEVNRLAETAPEITDVLLSVMGTKPGCVKIEEVGLRPFEIDVCASVWAASNPDEDPGPLEEIRRQLADRFDLVVPVQRPGDPAVVERILAGETGCDLSEDSFLKDLLLKASSLKDVVVPRPILKYLANLYVYRNVESLRAVEAMELSSRLAALVAGKTEVSFDELALVAPLVLRHRVEPLALSEILKDLEMRKAAGVRPVRDALGPADTTGADEAESSKKPESEQVHPRDDMGDGLKGFTQAVGTGSGGAMDTPKISAGDPQGQRQTLDGKTRPGRLQRALQRYMAAVRGRLGPRSSAVPASPPQPARRLSSLPWEEVVTPPEWQDDLRW